MELVANKVSRDEVLRMFRRENAIRKTDEIQRMYDENYLERLNDESVETHIQCIVLREHGYSDDLDNLIEYRKLPDLWRDDEEICDSVLFMKYNIIKDTNIALGDIIPNATLIDIVSEKPRSLYDYTATATKPVLLLAGSRT